MEEWDDKREEEPGKKDREDETSGREGELEGESPHPIFLLVAIGIALVIFCILAVIVWNMKKDRPEESEKDLVVTEAELTQTGETEESREAEETQEAGETLEDAAAPSMEFEEVSRVVTPKEAVNLRTVPSTASENTIVVKIKNGEKLICTGVNKTTGWSRVTYKDLTLYAVSRYLIAAVTNETETGESGQTASREATQTATQAGTNTADSAGTSTAGTPAKPSDTSGSSVDTKPSEGGTPAQTSSKEPGAVVTRDGRSMTFTPCDDMVSPKMEVNLRGEPSTSLGNDSIHYRLKYGEQVHRTGYNEDTGWSRVEYEGEVLYAVTSYLFVVEK